MTWQIVLSGIGCSYIVIMLLIAFWNLRDEILGIALIVGFGVFLFWSIITMSEYLFHV